MPDFHDQIKAAYLAGTILEVDQFWAICPVCAHIMAFCERSKRMTYAGPEDACLQYHCDNCGEGAEIDVKRN